MTFDLDRLQNANVIDQDGDKVGSVGQIYVDDQTNEPTFATVKTGLFGTRETFVPLNAADFSGDDLRVPYTKDFIKDAPNVDADGHITEQEQDEIYRYYQLGDGGRDAGRAGDAGREGVVGRTEQRVDNDVDRARDRVDTDADRVREHHDEREVRRDERRLAEDDALTGRDTDRLGRDSERLAGADDALVRREEELRVGKERAETGRVRLRKHVVTDQKTVTVPVEREEVEVVREDIPDGAGSRGGQLGEDEQVVSISEERPVVDKEVVDKERVGLRTNTVQDQQQVQAEVGREEVSVEQDGAGRDGKESLVDRIKDDLHRDRDHDGVKDKHER